ncbi:MAG: DUF1549 domain-containing protein [Planctomycetes bacterium]|nr:DUF1549 domain-containing protein [Planctomycetota bacterium]
MNNDQDRLLEVCLEEVLGGESPPDLSDRILRAWALRAGKSNPMDPVQLAEYERHEPEPPPVQLPIRASTQVSKTDATDIANVSAQLDRNAESVVASNAVLPRSVGASPPAPSSSPGRLRPRLYFMAAAAACLALVLAYVAPSSLPWQLAEGPPDKPVDPRSRANETQQTGKTGVDGAGTDARHTAVATDRSTRLDPARPDARANSGRDGSTDRASPDRDSNLAQPSPPNNTLPDSTNYRSVGSGDVVGSGDAGGNLVSVINSFLAQSWSEHGVKPGGRATESEWCRRAFVRVLGRIPTVEELKQFESDRSSDKRAQLVDRLLSDPAYLEEFAGHWSLVWTNVLIGRSNRDGIASREGLIAYLRDALRNNRPYDQMARELITATGSATPGSEDFNGAVNFILANENERRTLITAKTAQVFLGTHLQCVQCHNHPTNDMQQDSFWQANSFFRQIGIERDAGNGRVRVVNRDFPGEGRNEPGEALVYFERPNGQMKAAYPVLFDGTEVPHSGFVSEFDRRAAFAENVVQSSQFARVMVNRLWSHFLGQGFTKPIDDIGPHNPPSHPELIDRLAAEFKASHFDARELIRWITLSEPFGLSSRITAGNEQDAPELGNSPLFSRYYSRQMQVEEVVQSLELLARNGKSGPTEPNAGLLARAEFFNQFSRNIGTDDGTEENTFNGGIPQSLFLMNGELTGRVMQMERGTMLHLVATSGMPIAEKIEHLFQASLSRRPSPRELQAAKALIAKNADRELEALQDIWWALLNSNEFIVDH